MKCVSEVKRRHPGLDPGVSAGTKRHPRAGHGSRVEPGMTTKGSLDIQCRVSCTWEPLS